MLWGRKVLNMLHGIIGILICYNFVQFSIYFSYSDDSWGLLIASPVMLFHWHYPKCKKVKALYQYLHTMQPTTKKKINLNKTRKEQGDTER